MSKNKLWINFLDLEIWHEAKDIAVEVFKITDSASLAKEWALRDQIRRCALSISSNIAEGSARWWKKEFRYFLKVAKWSCGELISQLLLLQELWYIEKGILAGILDRLVILLKRTGKLIWSLTD